MRAASKYYWSFVKAVSVASLGCVLVPICGAQAQSNVQADLRNELAAPFPARAAYTEPMAGDLRGVTRKGLLPLPGAQVTVHSVDRGTDRTVTSGNDGAFVAANLKPGTYRLTATSEGFATAHPVTVDVTAGQSLKVDMTLGLSAAAPARAVSPPASAESASAEGATGTESPARSTPAADPEVPPAVAKQLEAMEDRIALLEAELANRAAAGGAQPATAPEPAEAAPAPAEAAAAPESSSSAPATATTGPASSSSAGAQAAAAKPPVKDVDPFPFMTTRG